ncbi:MAG TPA: hypothetical protein EYQ00_02745 [Dehalococcoidia bacterium]|nr:hypothetical protein [Dehalococcoidia bacterium]
MLLSTAPLVLRSFR